MVNKSRQVSAFSGVDDSIEVYPEEVGGSDAGRFVLRLAHVGDYWSNHLADVLYYHFVGCYWLLKTTLKLHKCIAQ